MKYCVANPNKEPIRLDTGAPAHAYAPEAQYDTLAEATADAARRGVGYCPGVVLEYPYFCIDLDGCYDDDGTPFAYVGEIVAMYPGAYLELSPGGRGIHIIGQYAGPRPAHACKNKQIHGELYTGDRYIRLNPTPGSGSWETVHSLDATIATYFAPHATSDTATEWTTVAVDGYTSTLDDAALVAKALGTTSMFGTVSVADLWRADAVVLSQRWPKSDGPGYDGSNADSALAAHLLFWTGGNCERTRELMLQSDLVRDKWDRDDYLYRTITRAAGICTKYFSYKDPTTVATGQDGTPAQHSGTYLSAEAQGDHFAECTYIIDMHRIATPRGLLKPDVFRAVYGGFEFAMDAGTGKTSKSAWEAFTESRAVKFPVADSTEFRPRSPTGALTTREGKTYCNIFKPAEIRRTVGDVTPFLDHAKLVIPDDMDRARILAYIAAVVQYQGVKFQWAPLIQGVEGNGKTLFTEVAMAAVGRVHSHVPSAKELDAQFNAWLYGTTLVCVEDVYIPGARADVLETLKPMITNRYIGIEGKGVDQITKEICCNFIFNSNHKDAIVKTKNDRRFGIFYTAQQEAEDLTRDGMGAEYFDKLYGWLRNGDGFAMVSEWLHTYEIPDALNPALGGRAPVTTSTAEAITASASPIEQEILEAVAEGRIGFRGNFISSVALRDTLEKRFKISPSKLADILKGLGYIRHPALTDGRTSVATVSDGVRIRLYVKGDSLESQMEQARDVVTQYESMQTVGADSNNDRMFKT